MKKLVSLSFLLFVFTITEGKIVKFSVNMTGQTVDTNGVHIVGDFQDEAGFPTDWDPATILMIQEADTNIYSVVVNLPAFQKYEFKFVNGMFNYQVEFVPIQSRVDPILNDNRWIYIDSLSNDTMSFGAIRFSANAPMGHYLLRLKVDMQNEIYVDTINGVHVEGTWQGFDPGATRLYSFDGNVYQYIAYIDSANFGTETECRYLNGNQAGDAETIIGNCINGNNLRWAFVSLDTVLPVVCFKECSACTPAWTNSPTRGNAFSIYPNPAFHSATIQLEEPAGFYSIFIIDPAGRQVKQMQGIFSEEIDLDLEGFLPGVYFVKLMDAYGAIATSRIILQ